MPSKQHSISAVVGLAVAITSVAAAPADANWAWHHPRRAEVNGRLINQQHRITEERREGHLTASQAHNLRSQDRFIHQQERADVVANGGYLTKGEQHTLNQEENGVSGQIGH